MVECALTLKEGAEVKISPKQLLIVSVLFIFLARTGLAQAITEPGRVGQIKVTMAKIRSGKTVEAKTSAAEHLSTLARTLSNKEVTDELVADITSLLDSPDDSVRYWVAMALGNIGVAAKSAVPKLLGMLPKADCFDGAITSASGIRYALFKMGVKQPPRPTDCHPIAG